MLAFFISIFRNSKYFLCTFICCFEKKLKNTFYVLTFYFLIFLTKLPQEKLDVRAASSIYWQLKHPVFKFIPFLSHSQLRPTGYPSPHCAVLVWIAGWRTTPLVTKCFLHNHYLGKQRISLGVASILSMCLCPNT